MESQGSKFPLRVTTRLFNDDDRILMGILVGALGALGAMLVPGAVGHGIETHSVIVALAVVAVVLILGEYAAVDDDGRLTCSSLCYKSLGCVFQDVLDRACVPQAPQQAARCVRCRPTCPALGPPQSPHRRCSPSAVCYPCLCLCPLLGSHFSVIWDPYYRRCHPSRRPSCCERRRTWQRHCLCERPGPLVSWGFRQVVARRCVAAR